MAEARQDAFTLMRNIGRVDPAVPAAFAAELLAKALDASSGGGTGGAMNGVRAAGGGEGPSSASAIASGGPLANGHGPYSHPPDFRAAELALSVAYELAEGAE